MVTKTVWLTKFDNGLVNISNDNKTIECDDVYISDDGKHYLVTKAGKLVTKLFRKNHFVFSM